MKLEKVGLKSTIKTVENNAYLAKNFGKVLDGLYKVAEKAILDAHSKEVGRDIVVSENVVTSGMTVPIMSDIRIRKGTTPSSRTIIATGENFVFYEFGAGIRFNRPRDWENTLNIPVPIGIVPIGTYGKGKGVQPSWIYFNETDSKFYQTSGYPAVHGFANAINQIVAQASNEIKKVKNDKK